MSLPPADLVHPHLEQVLQPVRVEPVGDHPFDDPPGGVPVDADQPGQRGLVHGGRQPAHQVLEVPGEPGTGPGERHTLGDDPVHRAAQPPQVGPDPQPPGGQVQVPPRRGHRSGVVPGLGGEFTPRATQQPRPQPHADHDRVGAELHIGHGDTGQVQQALEYRGDTHTFGPPGSVAVAAPNLTATACVSPQHRSPTRRPCNPANLCLGTREPLGELVVD